MNPISVENLGVCFKKNKPRGRRSIAAMVAGLVWNRERYEDFWALKDITFSVARGEALGIVGNNGAGKSTLLRLLTEVLYPDAGSISIDGKVSALLAVGAGLVPELSGRDNIYLCGIFLGISERDMHARLDDIVAFAELEDFIDSPVKHYSSGMKSRLGFSVAVHVDPGVLIIDELLGAGDINFRKKAGRRMREFVEKADAIVFATHNMELAESLCTNVLWLEHGRMKMLGPASEVIAAYTNA